MPDPVQVQESEREWRVLWFFGSVHMGTATADDEREAREIAERYEVHNYRALIQVREIAPWRDA